MNQVSLKVKSDYSFVYYYFPKQINLGEDTTEFSLRTQLFLKIKEEARIRGHSVCQDKIKIFIDRIHVPPGYSLADLISGPLKDKLQKICFAFLRANKLL